MLNASLKVLLGINLVFVFGQGLLGPLYAVFVERRIGGNVLDIGWAFAVYMITIGVMSLLAGKLADKTKEKEYFVMAGYLIRAFTFLAFIFIDSIFQLMVLQFILGFAEAIATPAFNAIYSMHLDKKREVTEWGINYFYTYIIFGVAAIVGALIVNYLGFSMLFAAMSVFAFVAFFLMLFVPRKLI